MIVLWAASADYADNDATSEQLQQRIDIRGSGCPVGDKADGAAGIVEMLPEGECGLSAEAVDDGIVDNDKELVGLRFGQETVSLG